MEIQLDCAHGKKGIEGLRSAYQALLDANAGLDATNEWLDSEDEILERMPLLQRDQIKVSIIQQLVLQSLMYAYRAGKQYLVKMGGGLQQPKLSMQLASIYVTKA